MTARLMRENSFRFEITHKLWLMSNHRPRLDRLDDAVRGRIHLLPFDMRWNRPGHAEADPALPNGDRDLMEALSAEREGILAWMVAGAVQALRDGLRAPAEVTRATRDYLAQEDHFGQWLQTRKRCSAANGGTASKLLIAFLAWARAEAGDNFTAPSQKAFGLELVRRGIEKRIGEQGTFYGLMLPDPLEDQD